MESTVTLEYHSDSPEVGFYYMAGSKPMGYQVPNTTRFEVPKSAWEEYNKVQTRLGQIEGLFEQMMLADRKRAE